MDFETWFTKVQHIVTYVIESEDWRRYYDAGLSPEDAIAQHRTDEDV